MIVVPMWHITPVLVGLALPMAKTPNIKAPIEVRRKPYVDASFGGGQGPIEQASSTSPRKGIPIRSCRPDTDDSNEVDRSPPDTDDSNGVYRSD